MHKSEMHSYVKAAFRVNVMKLLFTQRCHMNKYQGFQSLGIIVTKTLQNSESFVPSNLSVHKHRHVQLGNDLEDEMWRKQRHSQFVKGSERTGKGV